MAVKDYLNSEFIFIAGIIYIFFVISLAKLGSGRVCGGLKALIISTLLTPLIGLIYVIRSPQKNTIKIIHYRCPACNLDYTSKHRYCPSCQKEGKSIHLEKISMKSY